ncbi:MAG: phage shock protein operon transcriptional activator [Gammaproteobacteria bacterium]|nr:phage shock protein operon transcriptional activator [Gammaproteobacteria bacterium]
MTIHGPETTPIIGEAPSFLEMQEHVSRAAKLNKPVLVIGERGTGKELIANRLHYLSGRWEKPLIKLNCAVLTESILESELFGHEVGSFTGAVRTHFGCFERSHTGTLFLDELSTIPVRMQEKILRVIEYGEFERVGGTETIHVDLRIVGASNEDLPLLVRQGHFRPDLLDRLAFDVIAVPPLRAREEDILQLANHFALNIVSELKREFFPGFSHRAASSLLSHSWPGNVRELKHTVERSVYRSDQPEKPLVEIVFDPFDSPYIPGRMPVPKRRVQSIKHPPASPMDSIEPSATKTHFPLDLKGTVGNMEIHLVREAMKKARFRQPEAAKLLGLSYHQLRGLLRKHNLQDELGRKRHQEQ